MAVSHSKKTSFNEYCEKYFEGVGDNVTSELAAFIVACLEKRNAPEIIKEPNLIHEPETDPEEIFQGFENQIALLEKLSDAFDEKVFAIGNTCVAAIHYQKLYEGMGTVTFASLREDFPEVTEKLRQVSQEQGLIFDGSVNVGGVEYQKPYVRVGDGQEWIAFYPLDNIPSQNILKFKMLRESKDAMSLYKEMESKDDYSRMPSFISQAEQLRRYEGVDTGIRTCLFNRPEGGFAGERTISQKSMEESNLIPTRPAIINGVKIYLPHKVGNWTTELTEAQSKVLAKIQEENLDSLVKLDAACEKGGFNYFLCGGSMLGAYRSAGFIPWDDDVDVAMLRGEYKRFCKEINKYIDDEFFVSMPKTDKHIHFVYARLRKDSPLYITAYNEDKDFHKGLWIDVFPFDAMPKSATIAKIQRRGASIFARVSSGFKRRREYVMADLKTDLSKLTPKDKKYLKRYRIKSIFFPVTLCRVGYYAFARFFNPFYAKSKNARYASFIPSYTTISRDELFPMQKKSYEGKMLNVPNGGEAFLVRQYGDYTKLPLIHERYSEHGFKCLILEDGTVLAL